MKLYKFRSLNNFDRIVDILTNNKFHLSNWNDLNDPMEGYFQYIICNTDLIYKEKIERFISSKNELKICAFSSKYHPILLWTNYADQHKGIAIEITLNPVKVKNLYKITYGKNIPELNFDSNPTPIDVLSRKIKFWSYEKEYRYIDYTDSTSVGKITGIYFGIRTELYYKNLIHNLINNSIPTYETKLDFDKNRIVTANNK